MTKTPVSRLPRSVRRFGANTAGVAAIEFAYLAPLLILATFGTFEVARAVLMHKRFQRVSAMVGDLVAREQQIGTNVSLARAEMDGIMKSAKHVMSPFKTNSLKVSVMSIRAKSDDATKTKIEWSYGYQGGAEPAQCSNKGMPATGMITQGNAEVMVEAEYTYTPLLANLVPGFSNAITWKDTITHSPRNSCVDYAGQNCVLNCNNW
jgi:Flp pilus assembly protein TadG